jgi:hypothetical protein
MICAVRWARDHGRRCVGGPRRRRRRSAGNGGVSHSEQRATHGANDCGLARAIVTAHHGDIRVNSSEKSGTTFEVRLQPSLSRARDRAATLLEVADYGRRPEAGFDVSHLAPLLIESESINGVTAIRIGRLCAASSCCDLSLAFGGPTHP